MTQTKPEALGEAGEQAPDSHDESTHRAPPKSKRRSIFKRKSFWLILAGIFLLIALPFIYGIVFPSKQLVKASSEREFIVDESFTDVRKILVRKDVAKDIIALGGDSEFVEQKWKAVGGDINPTSVFDLGWKLELHGTLKVRILDEYIGKHVVPMDQKVVITVDLVDSRSVLEKGTDRLIAYDMVTRFSRTAENKTKVELKLMQEINADAPWFASAIAKKIVLQSVEKSLLNQERGIRQVIEENKHDLPIFPLR